MICLQAELTATPLLSPWKDKKGCLLCPYLTLQFSFGPEPFSSSIKNLTLFSRSWSSKLVLMVRSEYCTPEALCNQPCRVQPAQFNQPESSALTTAWERNSEVTCTAQACSLPLWSFLCWSQTRMRIWTLATYWSGKLGQIFASLSLRIHTLNENNQTNLIALFDYYMTVNP